MKKLFIDSLPILVHFSTLVRYDNAITGYFTNFIYTGCPVNVFGCLSMIHTYILLTLDLVSFDRVLERDGQVEEEIEEWRLLLERRKN